MVEIVSRAEWKHLLLTRRLEKISVEASADPKARKV